MNISQECLDLFKYNSTEFQSDDTWDSQIHTGDKATVQTMGRSALKKAQCVPLAGKILAIVFLGC